MNKTAHELYRKISTHLSLFSLHTNAQEEGLNMFLLHQAHKNIDGKTAVVHVTPIVQTFDNLIKTNKQTRWPKEDRTCATIDWLIEYYVFVSPGEQNA